MKKVVILIFIIFIMIAIVSNSFVLADKDESNLGNDDSGDSEDNDSDEADSSGKDSEEDDNDSEENKESKNEESKKSTESTTTIIDEQGIEIKIKTETETNEEGETEVKEVKTYTDENGNTVEIVTKTETKGDEQEVKVEKRIINPDGTQVVIKTKTEITAEEEKISYSIKVKGTEVKTALSVESKNEEGETKLVAKLSTGAEQEITILPDEALLTALEELKTTNNLSFEIKEISTEDKTKAVFSAKAEQEGQLFGLFNVQVNLETLVDITTGEVIQTNRPWWAFLVVGEDQAEVCHISDLTTETLSVPITEVKSYLEQGDSVGACPVVCGDGFLTINEEVCELGDSQECTTSEGYSGTNECNSTCDFNAICITIESCGDEIINGLEECDDGNLIDGDGCSNCLIDLISGNETNSTI